MPGGWPNRLPNAWERLLHFTKTPHFAMYRDAVMIPITSPRRWRADQTTRHYSGTGSGFSFRRANFVDEP
jgi:site-specific DNA-methyltransferase (adenine-specific)/site-specific DNA-methyltransferase (cytosine-N4-specific)